MQNQNEQPSHLASPAPFPALPGALRCGELPSAAKFRGTDRDARRLAEGVLGTGDKRRGHVTPREQGKTAPHPCTHDTGLSNGTKKKKETTTGKETGRRRKEQRDRDRNLRVTGQRHTEGRAGAAAERPAAAPR